MNANVIVSAWNRSLPGREHLSAQHFQEFSEYLGALKRNGTIESFEVVFLEPHGGALNGFFLIRGQPAKLTELTGTEEWVRHQIRSLLHLEGFASLRGHTGAAIAERMAIWSSLLPK